MEEDFKPIRINPKSKVDVYQQIINGIIDRIAIDAIRPGERLPTVATLAKRENVSHGTATRVYKYLEERGIIKTARKRGSWVAEFGPEMRDAILADYGERWLDHHVEHLRTVGLNDALLNRVFDRLIRKGR